MISNSDFNNVIFELFIGSNNSKRDWQKTDFEISRLIFDKLGSILKNTDSLETRLSFFKIDVLRKLLDKLKILTNEICRKYDDTPEKIIKIKKKEESLIKEIKKRKGVGYDKEGTGQK